VKGSAGNWRFTVAISWAHLSGERGGVGGAIIYLFTFFKVQIKIMKGLARTVFGGHGKRQLAQPR